LDGYPPRKKNREDAGRPKVPSFSTPSGAGLAGAAALRGRGIPYYRAVVTAEIVQEIERKPGSVGRGQLSGRLSMAITCGRVAPARRKDKRSFSSAGRIEI
jgi:hypothetical protein